MLSMRGSVLVFLLGLHIVLSPAVLGQQAMQGVFGFSEDTAERASLRQAIDAAVTQLPTELRGRWRARLTHMLEPAPRIRLARDGDQLLFQVGSRKAVFSRDDGGWEPLSNEGRLRQRIVDGELIQTFVHRSFTHERRYRLGNGGATLIVRGELASDRLEAPIRYRLSYERK